MSNSLSNSGQQIDAGYSAWRKDLIASTPTPSPYKLTKMESQMYELVDKVFPKMTYAEIFNLENKLNEVKKHIDNTTGIVRIFGDGPTTNQHTSKRKSNHQAARDPKFPKHSSE
jgi:phage terminase small subunit